jgi:hypothetical protein
MNEKKVLHLCDECKNYKLNPCNHECLRKVDIKYSYPDRCNKFHNKNSNQKYKAVLVNDIIYKKIFEFKLLEDGGMPMYGHVIMDDKGNIVLAESYYSVDSDIDICSKDDLQEWKNIIINYTDIIFNIKHALFLKEKITNKS